jgi:hypothetical protein
MIDMGMCTEEQFYELLKRRHARGQQLTEEQREFVMDFASKKLHAVLEDPNVLEVFKRLADK